jgi:tRNA1(Val) A37 N6-methylase TrmN6
MMRHDTPWEVARELAKFAPKKLCALLDPAVGAGALLGPILRRADPKVRLFCVDSDQVALREFKEQLPSEIPEPTLVHADFLTWSEAASGLPLFDCVAMNPPFSGRKQGMRPISVAREFPELPARNRMVPIEAAFVARAVRLLRNGGRLLAILPASIVMSENLQWLRDSLCCCGAIQYVHELPRRTFPNVESGMYLFVFEKGHRQRRIVLFNHDLEHPERMEIRVRNGEPTRRLDYGFHRAQNLLRRLVAEQDLEWTQLGEIAGIVRGTAESPGGASISVHSTDYHKGYWRRSHRHKKSKALLPERAIQPSDILIRRVGRECRLSCGPAVGLRGMQCSDCVLIVRPNCANDSEMIQFALRAVLALPWARPLVERGTGAAYISEQALVELLIPFKLCRRFHVAFGEFCRGIKDRTAQPGRLVEHVAMALNRHACAGEFIADVGTRW